MTNVVDTTAAGDSFNACVYASVARQDDLMTGIKQGCRLAKHVVQHKGALVSVDLDLGKNGAGL